MIDDMATPRRRPTASPGAGRRATGAPPTAAETFAEVATGVAADRTFPSDTLVTSMIVVGRAAGAYLKSLCENGIPRDTALAMLDEWHIRYWQSGLSDVADADAPVAADGDTLDYA